MIFARVTVVIVSCVMVSGVASAQRPLRVSRGLSHAQELLDPIREAASALQGNKLGDAASAAILDSALIEEAAHALRAIRDQVPGLERTVSNQASHTLSIAPTPRLAARLRAVGRPLVRVYDGPEPDTWRLPRRNGVVYTGDAALDSLNRLLGAVSGQAWGECKETPQPFCPLSLSFAHYINSSVVARAYSRVPGVRAAYAPPTQELRYLTVQLSIADAQGSQWLATFREERGDCSAGCISSRQTVVRYDRASRRAMLVRVDTLP
jgi:hypothetical protein